MYRALIDVLYLGNLFERYRMQFDHLCYVTEYADFQLILLSFQSFICLFHLFVHVIHFFKL